MTSPFLFATDLDRTLFPNGPEAIDSRSVGRFETWRKESGQPVAFVTGRHLEELIDGCREYGFSLPDYAATDVGSRLFKHSDSRWEELAGYAQLVLGKGSVWNPETVMKLAASVDGLRPQEDFRQNEIKCSFYAEPSDRTSSFRHDLEEKLVAVGMEVQMVDSIDEEVDLGLVDVLPRGADKLGALLFLQDYLGLSQDQIIFCGDSGNDLRALSHGFHSVCVRNAPEALKATLRKTWSEGDRKGQLYIAGGKYGFSGYYTEGVLEGLKALGCLGR